MDLEEENEEKAKATSGSREWNSARRCQSLASPYWDKSHQNQREHGLADWF